MASPVGIVVAASTKVLLDVVVLSNPGINETVRRTRGIVLVESDQDSINETFTGAIGMAVVTDLAIAAGAASIPGPVTDANDDGWFVWQPFAGRGSQQTGGEWQAEFDSKAMRRIEEGYGVAVMVENASPTFGLEVILSFSMLTSFT